MKLLGQWQHDSEARSATFTANYGECGRILSSVYLAGDFENLPDYAKDGRTTDKGVPQALLSCPGCGFVSEYLHLSPNPVRSGNVGSVTG